MLFGKDLKYWLGLLLSGSLCAYGIQYFTDLGFWEYMIGGLLSGAVLNPLNYVKGD